MRVAKKRKVVEIPPEELDRLLCNFHIIVKTKDNSKWEPDAMSSFSWSIQRFPDQNNARVNIRKNDEFKISREVLKCKHWELRKQGKGNILNATVAMTNEDVEIIFEEYQFGVHEPEVLARTMWLLLTLHFGHRARHESRQMKFSGIALKKGECRGAKHPESCPSFVFQLKSSPWHVDRRNAAATLSSLPTKRLEQNPACKSYTFNLFFFTVTLSYNKFRWYLPKLELLFQNFVRVFVFFSL